jgi:hypothetical protein
MQREFGKRTAERVRAAQGEAQAAAEPPARPKSVAVDADHMRKAVLAIVLTITMVGGMFFVLPMMGQCDGHRGVFGLDWCRLMKASLEGAARGVAAGRGAIGH